MIDLTALSRLVSRITEELMDSEWDEVRTVAIVTELEGEDRVPELHVFSSDDRPWVLEKFLDEALDAVERARSRLSTRMDDDE